MAELRLVREGQSDYPIIIATDAEEPERFAASELQKYISLISGARMPIKEGAKEDKAIWVGTKFVDRADLGEDGFIIRAEKERIILGGNTPRATLFSVYAFLEKYIGCGWCMPGDDTLPEKKTIVLSDIDDVEKPTFSYRGIVHFPYNAQRAVKEIDWLAKNRLNWSHIAFNYLHRGERSLSIWEKEKSRETFIPELKKRGLALQFGGHAGFTWVPPDQYFETHPEYYSFIDGKRTPYQLCISNPDVISTAAEHIKGFIQENPEVSVIDLWIQDAYYWCDCADCQAIEEKQPSLLWDFYADEREEMLKQGFPKAAQLYTRSKSYLIFVNKVAEAVAKAYPNVMLNNLAYANLCDVPVEVSPAENVQIGFASLGRGWAAPINSSDHPLSKVFSAGIEAWARETRNLYIYAYYGVRVGQAAIAPIIQEDLKYYQQLGIDKIASESVHWHDPNWFGVNLYVYAKLIWNPEIAWQELVADFCHCYYGKAAAPMTNQWLRIQGETDWQKHREECLADIQTAKSLAENDKILARIAVVEEVWKNTVAEGK